MLKSKYLLLLLLLIAPAVVFSQKSYDGIIRGTIIDAETQSPVEDAVIEILNTGNKTTTDSTGNFFFQNLKYDSYQIKISGSGYDPLINSNLIV